MEGMRADKRHKKEPKGSLSCVVGGQEETGRVFVGDFAAASSLYLLKIHNIGAIVTAAFNGAVDHPKSEIPYYKFVPGYDYPDFQLCKYFEEVSEFIKEHRKTTNVLVHCMAGVSRSAALVIAYLIRHEGKGFQEAYSEVKARRMVIRPNKGFLQQLKSWKHAQRKKV